MKVIHNHVFKAYKYYRDADRKFLVDIPRSIREFEAEYAYRNALTPDDVMTFMKPFLRFVEAYKSMYTDLMADLKKIHKKNRIGRLFLSEELFNRSEEEAKAENNDSPKKEEVDDTVLYSSWSMYYEGDRIPTWLRLLDKDRVDVFLDKSNKRAVPITDEEKLDWLLWRDKADVLRSSAEEVEIRLLW